MRNRKIRRTERFTGIEIRQKDKMFNARHPHESPILQERMTKIPHAVRLSGCGRKLKGHSSKWPVVNKVPKEHENE